MSKSLIISGLVFFFAITARSQDQKPCEPFPAEVSTENAGPSSPLGKITVKYAGDVRQNDVVLHLYYITGGQKWRTTGVTEFKDLKPGKYVLVISEKSSRFCFKKVDLEITPKP